MKLLVKLGGTLLDTPSTRARLAAQLASVRRGGAELVVVHGGGKQMTRYLAERGVQSSFVNGLRVTGPEVVDALLKVFAGTVNHELVAVLNAAGVPAVGISGIDAYLAEAEQMDPALGAVGRVIRCNPGLLNLLTSHSLIPVVACVAGDRSGAIYNVNADQMAVACASAFGAAQLIFLTDVEGVLDESQQVRPALTARQCAGLIDAGIATGGMQAKLNAALDALRGGVSQVRIAPGAAPGILDRLLAGEPLGTSIVRDEGVSV